TVGSPPVATEAAVVAAPSSDPPHPASIASATRRAPTIMPRRVFADEGTGGIMEHPPTTSPEPCETVFRYRPGDFTATGAADTLLAGGWPIPVRPLRPPTPVGRAH